MRKLITLDGARADLREIARYIAKREHNSKRGAIAKRLADKCVEIAAVGTALGRPRPEFGHGLRSMVFLNYLIFFRYADDRLEVVAFIHGARDLGAAFAERRDE